MIFLHFAKDVFVKEDVPLCTMLMFERCEECSITAAGLFCQSEKIALGHAATPESCYH